MLLKVLQDKASTANAQSDSKTSKQVETSSVSKISINEFYKNYISGKITSRPEIVTFFVYYLSKSTDKKEFAPAEIKDLFKQVGYPNWNGINISDTLSQSKKRAFLNNYNSLWSLSMTGEDFVLNKLAE